MLLIHSTQPNDSITQVFLPHRPGMNTVWGIQEYINKEQTPASAGAQAKGQHTETFFCLQPRPVHREEQTRNQKFPDSAVWSIILKHPIQTEGLKRERGKRQKRGEERDRQFAEFGQEITWGLQSQSIRFP